MSLKKVWYNKVHRDHNFVVFDDDKIYRLKAKAEDQYRIKEELERGIISDKFLALPMSYIKKIEYQKNDKNLHLYFGKNSVDDITITNAALREEIFLYLKEKSTYANFEIHSPGTLQRIKKPLIALAVVLGIFIYVMSVINGMNAGYEYELSGGRPGIASIVLILAGLGAELNITVFTLLMCLAAFRIFWNLKEISEIHRISYK